MDTLARTAQRFIGGTPRSGAVRRPVPDAPDGPHATLPTPLPGRIEAGTSMLAQRQAQQHDGAGEDDQDGVDELEHGTGSDGWTAGW